MCGMNAEVRHTLNSLLSFAKFLVASHSYLQLRREQQASVILVEITKSLRLLEQASPTPSLSPTLLTDKEVLAPTPFLVPESHPLRPVHDTIPSPAHKPPHFPWHRAQSSQIHREARSFLTEE